ncbi:hypothetical protein E4U42_005864 [Claviceps africana]|uniref:Uncharacterized protein n=1 Tax=Claviceps africana TaxID=83212 RepID=A0A8K0J363_9HYPO|nr:hypothetical protein E4U42_005864 [Claviceps africana]
MAGNRLTSSTLQAFLWIAACRYRAGTQMQFLLSHEAVSRLNIGSPLRPTHDADASGNKLTQNGNNKKEIEFGKLNNQSINISARRRSTEPTEPTSGF